MPKFVFTAIRNSLLSLLLTILFVDIANADAAQEYAVKSALALNFARFTEWSTSGTTITLCVLGDQSMQQVFLNTVDKKTVGNKTLSVLKLSAINELDACQLLYVAAQHSDKIRQVREVTTSRHILTIGEDSDFLENGGMVNLETVEGKVNIQVNLNLVQQAKLQISARVLKLVTIVNF